MPSRELSARDAGDLRATAELVVTLVLFGSSFPAFKLATERFGVGTVVGLRFALATATLIVIFRGLPALVYRRFLTDRQALSAGLLQATSLSFVVAASQIGVELDKLDSGDAAGLVTGGVLSVLLFPVLALRLIDSGTPPAPAGPSPPSPARPAG